MLSTIFYCKDVQHGLLLHEFSCTVPLDLQETGGVMGEVKVDVSMGMLDSLKTVLS